jgi:predicted transcriptional regulator
VPNNNQKLITGNHEKTVLSKQKMRKSRGCGTKKYHSAYASLPTTLFASLRVCCLSASALKLLVWAHANYVPSRPTLLPSIMTARALGIERTTFASAKRELIQKGLISQTRDPIRPGAAGCLCGRTAAEFSIYGRAAREPLRFDVGDPSFDGYWRVDCENLRTLCSRLGDQAFRILICLVVPQHRQKSGELKWRLNASSCPTAKVQGSIQSALDKGGVTAARAAKLLNISTRTAQRALVELESFPLVKVFRQGAGRRPTIYVAHSFAADRLRRDDILPSRGKWPRMP